MPTYAPAPRQYIKRLTIPAGAEVLCFAPGVAPDEGVRVPSSEFSGGGSGAVGANPTGTIGLAVVNGSAATFLRSDGAPALSQAIVPTWTGLHTFTNGLVANSAGVGPIIGRADGANTNIFFDSNGRLVIRSSTSANWLFAPDAPLLSMRDAVRLGWSNGNASAALDTAFARNAAGVVEVNNGTAGTLADLIAKSIELPTQPVVDSPANPSLRFDGTNLRFWNGSAWKTVLLT